MGISEESKLTKHQLVSEEWLKARLPALLAEFRKDVESLGFTW